METFCTRLLVGLEGSQPDPHLLRYASMVARLGGHSGLGGHLPSSGVSPSAARTESKCKSEPSPRPRGKCNAAVAGGDAEVRIACLTGLAGSAPQQAAGPTLRRKLRDHVQTYFTGCPAGVPVGCDVLKGKAAQRLTELAEDFDSDLLLVEHSPSTRRFSERLAVQAPCPVWLVPPQWAPVLRHCLVPVDFSEQSAISMRAAIELARRSGGMRCLPLHVHANPTVRSDGGMSDSLRRRLQKVSEEFLSGIDCRGVRVEPIIEAGPSVAQVVGKLAMDRAVDLVVMATRRRTRSAGLIFPSQTAVAIRGCQASFLILKTSQGQVGFLEALGERLLAADQIQFG